MKYYKAFIRINNGNWVDMIITAKRKKDAYDIVENFYMKLNYIFRNIFNFNLIVEDQTTSNMIQIISHLFARKPLISKGI